LEDEKDSIISEDKVSFRWKRLIVPILLIISVIGLVYLINLSNKWFNGEKITSYEIEGLSLNNSKKFLEKAKEISFGNTKDSLLLEQIEFELEKDSYIKKCVATFAGPSTINLELEERYPFAFYMKDGKLSYIDSDGVLLPYKVLKKYSDMVVLSGFSLKDSLRKSSALNILKSLYRQKDIADFVSELRYAGSKKGFEIIGPFKDANIYVGSDEQIESKLHNLSVLMSSQPARKMLATIDVIDLRWKDRIIVKEI
jgi:hypothetical protein